MKTIKNTLRIATALSLSFAALAANAAVGLTADGNLITFDVDTPATVTDVGPVTGLLTDTKLVGIDFRVQDRKLYGVGDAGGVYSINSKSGAASLVNRLESSPGVPVALDGTLFGVDFNPAADRLRIVSNTGQNLRHNVNAGGLTIVDTALNNGATPPVEVSAIVSSAYTNNDLSSTTATTLFTIGNATDQVFVQSPANNGITAATGSLGINAVGALGFDIYSKLSSSGSARSNGAYAAITDASGITSLYKINLLTGAAELVGAFPIVVIDLSLKTAAP